MGRRVSRKWGGSGTQPEKSRAGVGGPLPAFSAAAQNPAIPTEGDTDAGDSGQVQGHLPASQCNRRQGDGPGLGIQLGKVPQVAPPKATSLLWYSLQRSALP